MAFTDPPSAHAGPSKDSLRLSTTNAACGLNLTNPFSILQDSDEGLIDMEDLSPRGTKRSRAPETNFIYFHSLATDQTFNDLDPDDLGEAIEALTGDCTYGINAHGKLRIEISKDLSYAKLANICELAGLPVQTSKFPTLPSTDSKPAPTATAPFAADEAPASVDNVKKTKPLSAPATRTRWRNLPTSNAPAGPGAELINESTPLSAHPAKEPSVQNDSKTKPASQQRTRTDSSIILLPLENSKTFLSVNPFLIRTAIQNISHTAEIKVLRHGGLQITESNPSNLLPFSNLTELATIKIKITRPLWETEIRGVITDVHPEITNDQIKDEIEFHNPETKVSRVSRLGKPGTKTCLISFFGSHLPKHVKIVLSSHPVRTFVQPALQCFKCQAWGHSTQTCKGKEKCLYCSESHSHKTCHKRLVQDVPKCPNCGGAHTSVSNDCKFKVFSNQVQKAKQHGHMSLKAARSQVLGSGVSFADAVKGTLSAPASFPKPKIKHSALFYSSRAQPKPTSEPPSSTPNRSTSLDKEHLLALIQILLLILKNQNSENCLAPFISLLNSKFHVNLTAKDIINIIPPDVLTNGPPPEPAV